MQAIMNNLRRGTARHVVAFGAVMFSSSLMNNVFVTYYLELFLHSGITPMWFYCGQTVFMLWNAVNDPLFGWLSDNYLPLAAAKGRRTTAIKYGGALWAVAFLLVWFPPAADKQWLLGLHFTLSLCFYDGMLSYVEVNHNALLAEMTVSEGVRAKALSASALFAGIGSMSSYAAAALWDREALGAFRVLCVVLAGLAFVVFEVSARGLAGADRSEMGRSHGDLTVDIPSSPSLDKLEGGTLDDDTAASPQNGAGSAPPIDESPSFLKFIGELGRRRNFVVFLLLAFVQQFDCTYEKTFMSYTISSVAGDAVSMHARSTIISLSFMLPHVMTVLSFPMLKKYGVHAAVSTVLWVRVALMSGAWVIGGTTPWLACVFILMNRVVSEALCRLFPMVSSDLVDEDMYLAQRPRSLSASLIASVFFFSKFSQSLAPMLGYSWLPSQSGPPAPHGQHGGAGEPAPRGDAAASDVDASFVWHLLLCVVTACVLLQLWLWSLYTLKGDKLKAVKRNAKAQMESPVARHTRSGSPQATGTRAGNGAVTGARQDRGVPDGGPARGASGNTVGSTVTWDANQ